MANPAQTALDTVLGNLLEGHVLAGRRPHLQVLDLRDRDAVLLGEADPDLHLVPPLLQPHHLLAVESLAKLLREVSDSEAQRLALRLHGNDELVVPERRVVADVFYAGYLAQLVLE